MPIMLSTMNAAGKTEDEPLEVTFGKETLKLKYSRAKYTPKMEREINALAGTGQMGGMLAKMLVLVLTSWDVVDWHPEDLDKPEEKRRTVPVPLTAETLDSIVSIEAQGMIVKALTEAQSPNEEKLPDTNDSF